MTLLTAILISLVAIVCYLLIRNRFKENRAVRLISAGILAVILVLTVLYGAAVMIMVNREDDPHRGEEEQLSEIQIQARERVEDRILTALEYIENCPSSETSMKAVPFDSIKPQGRDSLTEQQKKIYDEILEKEENLEPYFYSAEEYGYPFLDDLLAAACAIGIDHPLTESYVTILEEFDGEVTTGLRSVYFMPQDADATPLETPEELAELEKELQIVNEEIRMIVDAVPTEKSVYDRYRYLATYISLSTEYDYENAAGAMISSPYGAIEGGWSICQGYSKAFEVLCERAGLWCRCVEGASDNEGHMWNLIQLEDGTYHVDITWSDDGYTMPDEAGWYEYFAVSQESILENRHEIQDGTEATGTRKILPPSLK